MSSFKKPAVFLLISLFFATVCCQQNILSADEISQDESFTVTCDGSRVTLPFNTQIISTLRIGRQVGSESESVIAQYKPLAILPGAKEVKVIPFGRRWDITFTGGELVNNENKDRVRAVLRVNDSNYEDTGMYKCYVEYLDESFVGQNTGVVQNLTVKECQKNCAGDGSCSGTSNVCTHGCKEGYKGPTCDSACDSNSYGQDCRFRCSQFCVSDTVRAPSVCHFVTGACLLGCQSGYEGPTCSKETTRSTIGLKAGVGVSCSLLAVALLVLAIVLIRRRKKKLTRHSERGHVDTESSDIDKQEEEPYQDPDGYALPRDVSPMDTLDTSSPAREINVPKNKSQSTYVINDNLGYDPTDYLHPIVPSKQLISSPPTFYENTLPAETNMAQNSVGKSDLYTNEV